MSRIATSERARNALRHELVAPGTEKGEPREAGVELYVLPFDARMASDRKYSVFCPPGPAGIAAVSQYRWFRPWRFAGRGDAEMERVAQAVLAGAEAIYSLIVAELRDGDEGDALLRRQGFSFDVLFDDEGGRCELVELNGFGARSSCGSCLFQWVRDWDVLYGGQGDVEFRVCV